MTLTRWKPARQKSMAPLTVKDVMLALHAQRLGSHPDVTEVDGWTPTSFSRL